MSDEVLHRVTYVSKGDDGESHEIHTDREDYRFWCPGCDQIHSIRGKGPAPSWTFNNDMVKPTFSPSHLTGWHGDSGQKFSERRCHSYIENGKIRFLSDCHHDLKGQTVPLPTKDKWRYGA